MTTNNFYRAQFRTPIGFGAGVIVLEGDSFLGGDSAIAYWGKLTRDGTAVSATIHTKRHSQGLPTVLGQDSVTFHVSGNERQDGSMVLNGIVPGTTLQFSVQLDRIAA